MANSSVKSLLLDVEGTTTSISFVKETLFPYIKENVAKYIEDIDEEELAKILSAFEEQASKDAENAVEGLVKIEQGDKVKESLVNNILWQMSLDRKTAALKSLQGNMWRQGYENGAFKGHVYPDVKECLRDWSSSRKIYIYSSGSVEAQKLLFKNSADGDLTEFLSGHFDVNAGPKVDKESYIKIATEIGNAPEEILFLTDVVKEAEAALAAGLQVSIVVREGNEPIPEEQAKTFNLIQSFADVEVQPCAKRARTEPANEKVSEEKAEESAMEVTETKETEESEETAGVTDEKMSVDVDSQTKTTEEGTTEASESNKTTEDATMTTEEISPVVEEATPTVEEPSVIGETPVVDETTKVEETPAVEEVTSEEISPVDEEVPVSAKEETAESESKENGVVAKESELNGEKNVETVEKNGVENGEKNGVEKDEKNGVENDEVKNGQKDENGEKENGDTNGDSNITINVKKVEDVAPPPAVEVTAE